jgi:hypothetical protein
MLVVLQFSVQGFRLTLGAYRALPGNALGNDSGTWEFKSDSSRRCGFLCYNLIHRAGTDALVTVLHGVHGVRFSPNFTYMGWKGLKQAKQLTSGKCSKDAGFPLTR